MGDLPSRVIFSCTHFADTIVPKTKSRSRKPARAKSSAKPSALNNRVAPADMSPQKFRSLGHRLIDDIADFYEQLPSLPTASPLLPNALRSKLGKRDLPKDGVEIAPVISKFAKLFFEESTHNGSPRFWGYITSSGAPVGALADLLAAAVNPNCGAWALSPVATDIENECIRWLAKFLGLGGKWDGGIVSGGYMAKIVFVAGGLSAQAAWRQRCEIASHPPARQPGVFRCFSIQALYDK